jgi:hypothetical protein
MMPGRWPEDQPGTKTSLEIRAWNTSSPGIFQKPFLYVYGV